MMLSIRGLYQIIAYVYEIINAYSIKSLMVVPFMNLLKSTLHQYHANVRFLNTARYCTFPYRRQRVVGSYNWR